MKLFACLCLLPCIAAASQVTGGSLTFDGLKNGEQVLSYYDGGLAGMGSGPGPSLGVSFTNGLAADSTVIAFGPSAVVTAPSVTMNLGSSWPGIFSFYFIGTGSVSFYSGTNATGSVLTYLLSSSFVFPFGASPGAFQSAVFTPSAGTTMRLDSLSFGLAVLPEPSVVLLIPAGLLLMISLRRYRH